MHGPMNVKKKRLLTSAFPSVRMSVRISSAPTERIAVKLDICGLPRKSVNEIHNRHKAISSSEM